jgi:CRP-like cAMP-binding protein
MVTSSSNQNVQLSQFLSQITLFQSIGVQKLNQLARSLTKQSYEDGQYIIRQGDIGEQFYVIHRGTVVVSKTDDGGNETVLITLGEGEVFGEQALIKKEPRKANIIAQGPVECYYLESHDFYAMLGEFVEKFNKINEFRIIRAARAFQKLSDTRLKGVMSNKLKYHRMFSGQRLVCAAGDIYFVIDGQFSCSYGNIYTASGEIQIGSIEKTADEVAGALTAVSDEGVLALITREVLQEQNQQAEQDDQRKTRASTLSLMNMGSGGQRGSVLMGPGANGTGADGPMDAEREILLTTERRRTTAKNRRTSLAMYMCDSLDGLELVQPLGRGTFGSVFLCKQKNTGRYMALKCLDKQALVESSQYHYVRREIIALDNFQHPFLASYYGVLLSPRKICLMLEFISGGELWTYLYNTLTDEDRGQFGGMELYNATLHAATVILALEHVHNLGYSYRDLKPENLLINSQGYLKLVDFGFAKQVPFFNKSKIIQFRTFTLCGTPDYMAP